MAEDKILEYTNGEVTVVWKPDICIHSANCVNGLGEVFNPKARPWVNMQGADSSKIVEQVKKCPSGALSFYYNSGENQKPDKVIMEKGKIAAKEPGQVELEAGKSYAWCSCGLSGNQPFCDGSHKETTMTPVVFKAEKKETAYLCQCKQTGNQPHCDGTHNSV